MSYPKPTKPCPFCGGTDLTTNSDSSPYRGLGFVRCLTCRAGGPIGPGFGEDVAAWDKRVVQEQK